MHKTYPNLVLSICNIRNFKTVQVYMKIMDTLKKAQINLCVIDECSSFNKERIMILFHLSNLI